MDEQASTGYSHTQKAPLCLILYGFGITAITLAVLVGDYLGIVIAGSVSLVLLLLAPCFHHLSVEDQGDVLAIRFGPIPLFRRTVRYADIGSVEIGRTLLLDGWDSPERPGRLGVELVGPDVRGRSLQGRRHAADRHGRRRESGTVPGR
ncbi:MAG: hypothetical protein U0744_18305 [Gemmataceae bacterium]